MQKISDFINNLFSENSSVSAMRVMSMMSLITSIILAFINTIYYIKFDKSYPEAFSLVSLFIGSAFSAKVVQKFAENKQTETEIEITKEKEVK